MGRTFLIGLDGASLSVLQPLCENETMSFLAELMRRGTRATLRSVVPYHTPSAWTSLVTSRPPGHHGIFDFVRVIRERSSMRCAMATSTDVQCETLWSLVSRQGRSVATLNFPVMIPPQPICGYSLAGFVTPRHLRGAVYPEEFYDQIAALPGFNARELAFDFEDERRAIQGLPNEEIEEWIRFHIRREERWLDIFRSLIQNTECDLFALILDGHDKISHRCWRFLDPKATYENPWEQRIHELCMSYYRRLDGILSEIAVLAGPESRLFLASDHGSGSTVERFYVNVFLEQEGYLTWASGVPDVEDGRVMQDNLRDPALQIDFTSTQACALGSGNNGIYLNVADGPGQSGIAPGEYLALRDEIRQKLLDFRDPETGEPVVTQVLTREEAFPGPEMERAADLTLQLRDGGFVAIVKAKRPWARLNEVAGAHRPDGFFLAAGPGIREGDEASPLSILDVAPALLYSLGLPIPSDSMGRLPESVFEESLLAAMPPETGSPTLPPRWSIKEATQLDAQVMEHLRALGYL